MPQLFRGPFLRKVALGSYDVELAERLDSAGMAELIGLPLWEIFERVYEVLLMNYRCEYVFKNAITQNWFLAKHSLERSYITDEFRVGKSRVDLAIFSNTSIAFEIKTEMDSTSRLSTQTIDYMKVFDLVYVVSSPSLTARVQEEAPKTVGILELTRSGTIRTVRPSESHGGHTIFGVGFGCLRQAEMLSIVEETLGVCLTVPTSRIYTECKNKIRHLLPFEFQQQLVGQLRKRRYPQSTTQLLGDVPRSLKHAALTLRASQREVTRIRSEFQIPPIKRRIKPTDINEHLLPIPQGQTERTACA